MKAIALERKYQLFPLQRYLNEARKDGWREKIKPPPILLSLIPELSRTLVERLELAGIHDSDDIMEVNEKISKFLEIPVDEFESIKKMIIKKVGEKIAIPQIVLSLPENYALIAVARDGNNNALALIWNHLLFSWSNSSREGWSLTKLVFDRFLAKADQPELIGSLSSIHKLPSWLDEVSDISTYVSKLIPGESITERAILLGYPPKKTSFSAKKKSVDIALELAYILQIAIKQSKTKRSLT